MIFDEKPSYHTQTTQPRDKIQDQCVSKTILPDRFNSVSKPTSTPIVSPELNSISTEKMATGGYLPGYKSNADCA